MLLHSSEEKIKDNFLLQHSVKELRIKKRENMTWTNLRHTAFVLMLQANPALRDPTQLAQFVANGFTSVQMFNDTYLKKLDIEESARKSRQKVARRRSGVQN